MRPTLYMLDEDDALVPIDTDSREEVLRWGLWIEDKKRCVVKKSRGNGLMISTVFLGIDHAFQGPPVCWETMVFDETKSGGAQWDDMDMDRCSGGRDQAEAMHAEMCRKFNVPV